MGSNKLIELLEQPTSRMDVSHRDDYDHSRVYNFSVLGEKPPEHQPPGEKPPV